MGVGPGAGHGRLWMTSTDGNWYESTLSGSSGTVQISINQTPLTYQDNSLGYQLLQGTDGNAYQVTLTGSAGSVGMYISQTPWCSSYDCKPYFFMISTDSCFYVVYANVISSGSVSLQVNQNSKTYLQGY